MSATTLPPRIGRFKLLRELGRGAQAVVWLAHDTRLDRDVALKLLNDGGDAVGPWLQEARAVSRLSHPHIVPVFEADTAAEAGNRPYLVFEYVKGPTLAAHLRERGGALPAREAVTLLLGVLAALRAAHECGIVHRDLKPSNILIDGEGRARVMDFGIAARVAEGRHDDGEAGTICGTPGYISPEAARGAAPNPAMDVFATGVMLAEMLSGQRLLKERDSMRALERVQQEDLLLPPALANGDPVDDALRAIVQRALERHSAARTPTAAALHQALQGWLQGGPQPAAGDEPAAGAAANATLDFLLRRMKHRSDFPAMSDSVSRIQRVANSENENLQNLSSEILKDVALTNKLLRMVNTASYSGAGGAVSTVSRAVALVGFAGIRNMALSLVLLDHMPDKGHATQLKEEFLRALMVGTLAGELTSVAREAEETFLSAMFQNLGRLLVEFYFPDEARQIRALDEPAAAQRILGINFEALGVGVAKAWGLPDNLQRAMRMPGGDAPGKAVGGTDRQRWLGRMAGEVTDALLHDEDGRSAAKIDAIAQRYSRALGVEGKQLKQAAEQAQQRLSQLAQAMNLDLGAKARARRLLAAPPAVTEHDSLSAHTLKATDMAPLAATAATAAPSQVEAQTAPAPAAPAVNVAELLANGVQDITNHMVADGCKLNEVLRMILETMYRALGFRRIVFCLRDAKSDSLTGRFGLGDRASEVAAAMKVPLRTGAGIAPDLFTAVCAKGADTLIADATVPAIANRLPPWFAQHVAAPSFLLLPLMMKNAPFALIYADQARPGGIALGEKELALLRTLRNQGVMAFRQAG
ncbi:MAG: HDOD domain-containing protein [Pseudomonadota bacterium]